MSDTAFIIGNNKEWKMKIEENSVSIIYCANYYPNKNMEYSISIERPDFEEMIKKFMEHNDE